MKTLVNIAFVIVTMLSLPLAVAGQAEAGLLSRDSCGLRCLSINYSSSGQWGGHEEINQILWELTDGTSPSLMMTVKVQVPGDDPIFESFILGPVADLASLEQINLAGLGTEQTLFNMTFTGPGVSFSEPLWNKPSPQVFGMLTYGTYNLPLAWSAAPVPEPSTFFLLGAGAAGLAVLQIRRRKGA